MESKLSNSLKS